MFMKNILSEKLHASKKFDLNKRSCEDYLYETANEQCKYDTKSVSLECNYTKTVNNVDVLALNGCIKYRFMFVLYCQHLILRISYKLLLVYILDNLN